MNAQRMNHVMIVVLASMLSACGGSSGGGGNNSDNDLGRFSTPQSYAMVVGTIRDQNGNALDDVQVKSGSQEVATNNQGYFALARIPEGERTVVTFTKPGFVLQSRSLRTRVGESSFLEVTLAPSASATAFNAGSGVRANNGLAAVQVPANSLVTSDGRPYNGEALITVTPFDPTTEAGHRVFPGRFEGVQANGDVIPIRSLGFVDITPTTVDGRPLQLRPGATADVEIQVAPAALATAPPTLPLWYFNPADGQWHEEGIATLSGNVYRGQVSHFSIWNCDVGLRRAWVIGRVLNCSEDGRPVKGARVTIQNVLAGWSSGEDSTPEDGTFRIPVNADEPVNLWAEKGGQKSRVISFTAPGRDETYNVGDVCLGVPKVQIVLTWGLNPLDLDAHLSIPLSPERGHVYFSKKQAGDAQLDTDDTTSFGPEMMTIYKLHDGVYRYSVHHFSGDGKVSTSQAYVHMTIDGLGIFEMRAPAVSNGKGDLWVLWDLEVRGGKVVNLTPRNTIVTAQEARKAVDP